MICGDMLAVISHSRVGSRYGHRRRQEEDPLRFAYIEGSNGIYVMALV